MANIQEGLKKVGLLEGVYSDNKADRGGKTKYGITEATLRRAFLRGIVPHQEIAKLKKEEAAVIYKAFYWDVMRLDEITDQDIANEMFECGINCGPGVAISFLQNSLRAIDQVTEVDGIIGNQTLAALGSAVTKWATVLFNTMNYQQGMYYMKICQGDASQLTFLNGWLNKRVITKA